MKLHNFPPVYYISLEESQDRQKNLEKQFQEHGITKYTSMIFKRFAECNDVIRGPYVYTLNSSNKGASTSHLKSIQKWLNETDEPYAVFFEDDVSFETVKYWSFDWEDFMNELPNDWEAVQLMWVRPHMVKIEFREKYPDDWSATAFMLTRSYGQRLLNRFMISDNEFNYDMGEFQPIVENVMFSSGKVYTIPLFVEETELPTTFMNAPEFDSGLISNGQGESHHDSQSTVLNWWKNIGHKTSLKKIMNNHIFPSDFDWGKFNPDLISSLKKEFGRENIYERFNTIKYNDIVVDIGASVGPFTYSILSENPNAVYCIEPSKDLFTSLVRNTSKFCVETPIVYINKAISDGNREEVKVFSGNENIYGGENDFDTLSFLDFVKDYKISYIDFLKMDCEGGEYDIFTDENIDWIVENVKYIAAEFHLTYSGCKEKFKNFRNKYLELFENYIVLSNGYQNISTGYELNLTRWIFDDKFLNEYHGELLIYIRNS
jgi:FkbM family methyltransferase